MCNFVIISHIKLENLNGFFYKRKFNHCNKVAKNTWKIRNGVLKPSNVRLKNRIKELVVGSEVVKTDKSIAEVLTISF